MPKIEWNKVTWYSKLIALIIFFGVFAWAFYLGHQYEYINGMEQDSSASNYQTPPTPTPASLITESIINNVTFSCAMEKTIQAQFMQNTVGQGSAVLELSDGRTMILPQAESADGARYAPGDDSFVFWNTGKNAFIEENDPSAPNGQKMTYSNCVEASGNQQ